MNIIPANAASGTQSEPEDFSLHEANLGLQAPEASALNTTLPCSLLVMLFRHIL